MHSGVLVRFGEIGIKSAPVRRSMVQRLCQNLLDALERNGVEGMVAATGSRIWMAGPDADALAAVARRTFGVVSVSPATVAEATLSQIGAAAAELALTKEWTTFAIRARREGEHPFSSMDLQRDIGSAVFLAAAAAGRHPKVLLVDPDLELHIDVRRERAYLFTDVLPGPGGLPVGAQGRVLALLRDEADALAAWLMMRRGCDVVGVQAGLDPARTAELVRLGLRPRLEQAPAGLAGGALEAWAATRLAARKSHAVVAGTRLPELVPPTPFPVLRPLWGLPPRIEAEVRSQAGWQA